MMWCNTNLQTHFEFEVQIRLMSPHMSRVFSVIGVSFLMFTLRRGHEISFWGITPAIIQIRRRLKLQVVILARRLLCIETRKNQRCGRFQCVYPRGKDLKMCRRFFQTHFEFQFFLFKI